MISKASSYFVRISPRKVRYVIDLIRQKSVREAHAILNGSPRRAGPIVQKLLNQAVDAAKKNSQVDAADLLISKILADGGPSMKRFRAASMGRASRILKRTSHIHLELDLIKKGGTLPPKGPAARQTAKATKREASNPAPKKSGKSAHSKMAGVK